MGHIKMMESGLFGELITTPQMLWFNGHGRTNSPS